MGAVLPFDFEEQAVRVVMRGDAPWFVAADVCRALELGNSRQALTRLDDDEKGVITTDIRFRVFEAMPSHLPPDTIGLSIVRPVVTEPGETTILTLEGDGDVPLPGDLVLFGTAASEAWPMIVTGVEAGQEMSSLIRLVDYAPNIDTLLAADVIPAWSSRVGAEIDENLLQPSAPRFTRIASGLAGAADPDLIDYLIVPGSGAIQTANYRVESRLVGAAVWVAITIPAANGGGQISGFASGDAVELRAAAVSPTGVQGPYTPVVTITIGAGDAPIPTAFASVTASPLLGAAQLTIATSADLAAVQARVYRAPTGVALDREVHAIGVPIPTTPASTLIYIDGDATRATLITNGTFGVVAAWTFGASWSYAGGGALHTPGATAPLDQAVSTVSGKWYRLTFTVSGRTAGTLQPMLAGGTDRPGTVRSANGVFADRIQAVTGNITLRFVPDSAFDGVLDAVTIWEETATSLAAGTYDYYAEPRNVDGLPGPVSGPLTLQVA